MNFMLRNGWQVSFLEEDCRTSLRRTLTFAHEDKIRELIERSGKRLVLEDKNILENAFQMGRGSYWLSLTEEQYRKLKL